MDSPKRRLFVSGSVLAWCLLVMGAPLLAAFLYSAVGGWAFGLPWWTIPEHLLLVGWGVFSLVGILVLLGRTGIHKWIYWILAFLGSFQYLAYLSATTGMLSWGDIPTLTILLRFFHELFPLARTAHLSPFWVLVILCGPPTILLVVLAALRRSLADGNQQVSEVARGWFRSGKPLEKTACLLIWLAWGFMFLKPDVDIPRFGYFYYDPFVRLVTAHELPFPETPRRQYWAQRDAWERKKNPSQTWKTRNIILVVVDALRADRVGPGRERCLTPFLDGMMKRFHGQRNEWAFSNGTESKGGILSLLTSKEPEDISQSNYTLPDFFADRGAHAWLILSGDHHWYNFKNSYGRSIERFEDGTEGNGSDAIGDDEALLRKAAALPDDDGLPHFMYFHLMSVHETGTLHETFLRYRPVEGIGPFLREKRFRDDPGVVLSVRNMYDDRVLQADDVIRRLFRLLESKGYLSDFAAVVTADHGQLLGEGGHFGHPHTMLLPGIHIPLLFLASSPLPPAIGAESAVQLDVAPTLASLAGFHPPDSWLGRSLLELRKPRWTIHSSPQTTKETAVALMYHMPSGFWKYDLLGDGEPVAPDLPAYQPFSGTSPEGKDLPFTMEIFRKTAKEAVDPNKPPSWEKLP